MISQEAELFKFHLQAITAIIYRNTPLNERVNLENFEEGLQQQILEDISPREIAVSTVQEGRTAKCETWINRGYRKIIFLIVDSVNFFKVGFRF